MFFYNNDSHVYNTNNLIKEINNELFKLYNIFVLGIFISFILPFNINNLINILFYILPLTLAFILNNEIFQFKLIIFNLGLFFSYYFYSFYFLNILTSLILIIIIILKFKTIPNFINDFYILENYIISFFFLILIILIQLFILENFTILNIFIDCLIIFLINNISNDKYYLLKKSLEDNNYNLLINDFSFLIFCKFLLIFIFLMNIFS